MKRLTKCLLALFFLVPASLFAAEELPFYFPEGVVVEKENAAKQYGEYLNYTAATNKRFQENHGQRFLDFRSIKVDTDLESTSKLGNKPVKMVLVLDNFIRLEDDEIRVTFFGEQRIISNKQLKVVIADLIAMTDQAAALNFEYYAKLDELRIVARAKALGLSVDEFKKCLDEKVDGSDITYRELNSIPTPLRKSDFVPRELHLGLMPEAEGVLGVTWLNSGLIYYNPQARVLDYLMGGPRVLQHEMIHVNSKFQRYPEANAFDTELLAMVPDGLYGNDHMSLFFHGYFHALRAITRAYFGFDYATARNRFVKFDALGNIHIEEKEYNAYCKQVGEIRDEMYSFFQGVVIPEFYSRPEWFFAYNKKMENKSAYVWLLMRMHYRPAILEGSAKTAVWLEAHKSEIQQMHKDAFKKSGDGKNTGFDFEGMAFLRDRYEATFTEAEREAFEVYADNHPEEIEKLAEAYKSGNFAEIINFVGRVKSQKGGRP